MSPMYIVIAFVAFEPSRITSNDVINAQPDMPLSLVISLCLPLVFLPISQELHQRGAAVESDKKIIYSRLIAALIFMLLGSLLVFSFSRNPNLNFSQIISGENNVAAIIIVVGLLSAILSTLDTSTNIASHAIQKLPLFSGLGSSITQILLLFIGVLIFLFFKTVLSIILFALFLYMAGPALTFIGVYAGIHPRYCAVVGAAFCSLQAFFHFKGGKLLEQGILENILPVADPVKMAILLLFIQVIALLMFGIHRRFA